VCVLAGILLAMRSGASISNYAPVQFRTLNVRIWLPQAVDAYCNFDDHRAIFYHTFTNFILFSVQTDQRSQEPRGP
jgi:hypothetical protein